MTPIGRRLRPFLVVAAVVGVIADATSGFAIGGSLDLRPHAYKIEHSAAKVAPAPPQAPKPAPVSDVQQLFDTRAHAILSGDVDAFMATVDEQRSGFAAQQRQAATNLIKIGLSSYSVVVLNVQPDDVASAVGGVQTYGVQAMLRTAFAGYDSAQSEKSLYLTLVRRSGRLLVADDATPDGRRTPRQLWDVGPIAVLRTPSTLVIGPEGKALDSYAQIGDRAERAVTAVWGEQWSHRVVLVITPSTDALAELLEMPADQASKLAGLTTGELRPGGQAVNRVYVNPSAFDDLSPAGRQVVVTHEVTHVAAGAPTSSQVPLWFEEGFADWVGFRGSKFTVLKAASDALVQIRRYGPPHQLPTDADLSASSADAGAAYGLSYLACRMIAKDFGQDRLVALYRTVLGGASFDQAVATVLGMSATEFVQQWSIYVSRIDVTAPV